MKIKLLLMLTTIILWLVPKVNFGQAPTLGAAADYAIFSTTGAITNSGINFLTQVTGNVGSITAGSVTGFGNINGQVHEGTDPANTACNLAVLSAYASLGTAIVDSTLGLVIGNGDTLTAATYLMPGVASLNNDLYLDAQGDPDAVFIFKTPLTFSSSANARIILINGALACNVFWRIDGAVNLGTQTNMRGTIISNGAISLTDGDSLEGRALAINAAVLITQSIIYTPIGCGSTVLTGPATPNFGTSACFALFTSIGAFTDDFGTFVNNGGDIGNNSGAVSGFDPLKLTGATHSLDGASGNAATDLLSVYNDLNALTTSADIELLQPTLFGHNLVLTPHIYHMASAVTFTDTVYLNAQNNPNAVFIILVNGRFDASPNSRVVLMNGAQARNVYWKIDGAVSIGVNSIFNGTIVAFGQLDLLTGVELNGRALVVDGALSTFSNIINTPPGCGFPPTSTITQPNDTAVCLGNSATFTVAVAGTSLTYQWRRGNVNLINGGNISGVNTATLTINPVTFADTASNYNVVIGGSPNDTSIFVSLTIISNPIITSEPANQSVCLGDTASFFVTASGQGLIYQWRKGNVDLIDGGNISGANSDTLTINSVSIADTASNYNVVISNICSGSDTSINVSLLTDSINITLQPRDTAVCIGNTASFSVTAIGSGLTYQWRKGNSDLVDGLNISGANTDSLTIISAGLSDASSNYNVVISGSCGANDTSINVVLTVETAPNITTEPSDTIVCVGSSASFTVVATGLGLTYQWRKGNVDLVSGGNIPDATSATLVINPVNFSDTASNYNVVISGGCFPNDTSINVSLTVSSPNIITQPVDKTVCAGDSVSFTVSATGANLTYQWRKGNVVIFGATNDTLTFNPVNVSDTAYNYNVIVTGTCSPNDTSNNVALNVNPLTGATIFTAGAVTLCENAADETYTATATNDTAMTYSVLPITAGVINATTGVMNWSATFTGTATITATATGLCGTTTANRVVTVNPSTGATSFTAGATSVCENAADETYTATATNDTSMTYSVSPVTAGVINSITGVMNWNATFTGTATITATANGLCGTTTANRVVTVSPATGVTSFTTGATNVCQNAADETYTATATNSTSITYSVSPATAGVINSATGVMNWSATFSGTATITATATGLCGTTTANRVVTVDPSTGATVFTAGALTVCQNAADETYTATAANSTSITYSVSPITAGVINANTGVMNWDAAFTGTATITATASGLCGTTTANRVVTVMDPATLIAIASSNSPVCTGSSINLSAQTVTGATYAWTGPNAYSSSTQNPVISSASNTNTGNYSLIVSNGSCSSAPSVVSVTVNNCGSADLGVVKTVNDTTPFINTNVVFTIVATNYGSGDATGVEINDIIQSGYAYISSSATTGAYDPSTGVWTIGSLNNGASATLTVTATVLASGNYVNTAVIYGNEADINMANNVSSIETFPTDFFIPEGFSPNGDGINDLFVIRGIYHYPNNSFVIFNRWGNKVFETTSYKNTWDGKSTQGVRVGGDELPVGTYFYIIDLGDGSKVIKGTIYLNR